ncbi:GntR family transcriptional regulator [Ornithinibacillus contaminans]|uniref:GntR family transcriptional regulator n=1 Tax=Ornithinibacillus contaminans TaxID=694055 RepID=UPI00064DC46B|nr:GntR family transcriptional regulator [Ornithinibacillus contaminans]
MSIKADARHLYLQVIDRIKHDIETSKYKANEKLPSEFELSKQLGVSRATLREALRILEEENVVSRKHGVGTFVNPKPIVSSGIEQLTSVTYMIEQAGKKPGSQFYSTDIIDPSEEDRTNFKSTTLQKLVKIERVRTADGQPVVFCVDKIPHGLIPIEAAHQEDSLFKLMEEHAKKRVSYAITYIEPVSYNEKIYNILNCDFEKTLLLLKQMHYTEDDEAVLYSLNYFRSDVFSFHVFRKRI